MKKYYSLIKDGVFLFLLLSMNIIVYAQTNPAAQSLPYTQNFSTLLATSTTYPAGWQGWNLSTSGAFTSFRLTPPVGDESLMASSTAATTTGGIQNYSGKIGILSTILAPLDDPSICLAINTTGFNNVLIGFNIMTIRNPYDGSANTRVDQVDLQYRVGTSGNFTSVSGNPNGIYSNNLVNQTGAVTTPQNQLVKSFTLPATCNNQPVVQIRWVQRDFSGVGSLPSFAVNGISICTSSIIPSVTITGPTAFCTGNSATYTATPVNGGTTPSYQWKKNGVNTGTNSAAANLINLVLSDQITCVMTTSASCATSATATSNIITIGTVNSSPAITSAVITNTSCPGAHNGAIDITVSGGTPPYVISWDTSNTANGPMFGVTVGLKSPSNPLFGQGNANGFIIDGIEEKELFLTKGITYTFNVLTTGHPFHVSTDLTGGNANFIVTSGQTGAPTQNGTVTFTPNNSHPPLLYYPCQNHTFMGWKIHIQSGLLTEDPSNLHAGTYSVIITDANGCTTSGQYVISELPSSIVLSATITDALCTSNTGSIDLNVSGGAGPYTVCWDTINTTNGQVFGVSVGQKTSSNPYFNLGNPLGFFIDNTEAKKLSLVRGFEYTFNIMNPGHPWHISTDSVGGNFSNLVTHGQVGAPIDVGTVTFTPDNSHPSLLRYDCANHQYMGYNINIVDPYCAPDLVNIHPGTYSVIVTDANGCSATASYIVNGIPNNLILGLNITTDVTCFGTADGTADIEPGGGVSPYTSSGTGPTFSVIVEQKNHSSPQYGLGIPDGFTIDGIQGKELTLIRGITYSFSVFAPGHAFYISTSDVGGLSNFMSEITDGVTNSMIDVGTLTFTPNANHPNLLYYQCNFHDNMGWKIHIVDQLPDGDLGNCMAGDYNISITDANGCLSGSSLSFTISEPFPNTFYFDADSDQYGNNDESALGGCIPPTGFAYVNGDCDDFNPAINPGAPEICNGIDDNCDGLVDDDDPLITGQTLWYEDADNDGYGDINDVGVLSCNQPLSHVTDHSDCNDNNSNIHPGATELCNGVDDNCDSVIDEGCTISPVTLNLKIYIEGYYAGNGLMDNSGGGGCLFVEGKSVVSTDADSIFISAMDAFSHLLTDKKVGILQTNGNVTVTFSPSVLTGVSYYLRIQHRNSIETWSASPVLMSSLTSYDFTSSQSQAFGNNMSETFDNMGWAIYSGDISDYNLGVGFQDGIVESQDYSDMENAVFATSLGYTVEDITGDGVVESEDYSLMENNVFYTIFAMRP